MRQKSFSKTDINRIFYIIKQQRRSDYIYSLEKAQKSKIRELPPYYELISLKFDKETRNTKLQFKQTQNYRTIEKYITQNYVKHPIFSEWKTRTKVINKTIKLTNYELENLSIHSDDLISKHATDIVYLLNDSSLYPSWFVEKTLTELTTEKINKLRIEYDKNTSLKSSHNANNDVQIDNHQKEIDSISFKIDKLNQNIKTLEKKIDNCQPSFQAIIICIITFGIFAWFISSKRREKLIKYLSQKQAEIETLTNEQKCIYQQIEKLQKEISDNISSICSQKKELDRLISIERAKLDSKLNKIKPLDTSYNVENSSFIMLKMLSGLDNQKIIGCYVIHNTENDKYYVGQSKDVLRRLKQHFKGTVPNNIIFAQDYYTSQISNKEDIFEVKIIPCQTKDELDLLERNLINKYDSFNSGYNGTQGNS